MAGTKRRFAAFEKQVLIEPSSKRAYQDLAAVLKLSGHLDRATKAYARHLELNPSDRALAISARPAVLTKIGWELADHGGYDARALELIDRATTTIAGKVSAAPRLSVVASPVQNRK